MTAVTMAVAAPSPQAAPLALEQALAIAESRSPFIAAQRAAAEAAAALVGPASQNPDPKLFFGLENLPAAGPDRLSTTADSMTMRRVGVMQDFLRADKRRALGARAEAEAQREAAMVETRLAELRREVATAWLERHYAERARALLQSLLGEAELQAAASTAELASGRSAATETVVARAMRAIYLDRLQELEQRARKATVMLARWIGDEAERPTTEPPETARLPRDVRRLEVDIEAHPEHAALAPAEAAAEAELRLAQAATQPDWSLELSYARRGGENAQSMNGDLIRMDPNMVSLMVRVDLPIFESRRQAPRAAARLKQLQQVRAQIEDSRQRHQADVRADLVDWETAIARRKRYMNELVPLAEERARTALAAYEGGRSELAPVLEARRNTLETRLQLVAIEAELARAWAQLAYLVPDRSTP